MLIITGEKTDVDTKDKMMLLEQWRTCVEMANQISSRRDTMNNLFITINLTLITAISFIWEFKSAIIACSGVLLCILWYYLIGYYRSINQSKYQVILLMEKDLPAQPFDDEWKFFKEKGEKEGTDLEKYLPIVFIVIYVLSILIIGGGQLI